MSKETEQFVQERKKELEMKYQTRDQNEKNKKLFEQELKVNIELNNCDHQSLQFKKKIKVTIRCHSRSL